MRVLFFWVFLNVYEYPNLDSITTNWEIVPPSRFIIHPDYSFKKDQEGNFFGSDNVRKG